MARVLIADDNDGIRQLVRQLCSPMHEVLEAKNGAEALAVLRVQTVDVAVLDLEMPVCGGREVCRLLHADARLRDVAVIVLTGSALDPNALLEGVDVILKKPSGIRYLLSSIDMLSRRCTGM